jgi:succinate-semialdehyde dehydrogenase/glutarate-semialdehyde dehydrogenase
MTVWEPAGEMPLSDLAQAVLTEETSFPKGSISVITSLTTVAEVGKELCKNKTDHKLSFTGSTSVGKLLMQQCLGGNYPFIVFNDAKMETVRSIAHSLSNTCSSNLRHSTLLY